MPGHKGLLGPQGTGILLCKEDCEPILYGGTGSLSESEIMPDFLPDRLEAGTLNVPGIAGLSAAISYLLKHGPENIAHIEHLETQRCSEALRELGFKVYCGEHQGGTLSFLSNEDCEEFAQKLAARGICVRAGLHCAPLAHKSAGTITTGTVRISYGMDASAQQTNQLIKTIRELKSSRKI
jgi:selenocysteine lyase/cysteine desulfurase